MTQNFDTKENRAKQFKRGLRDAKTAQVPFGQSNELGTVATNLDRAYRKGWIAGRNEDTHLTPPIPNIKTSGRLHWLKYFHELTPKERAELDYITDDTNSFLRHQGHVYDLGEFSRIIPPEEIGTRHLHPMCLHDWHGDYDNWDAYLGDSAFSMVLIRYERDSSGDINAERAVIGHASW
jgi:hypothetical protein